MLFEDFVSDFVSACCPCLGTTLVSLSLWSYCVLLGREHTCGCQKTIESWFPPATMWDTGDPGQAVRRGGKQLYSEPPQQPQHTMFIQDKELMQIANVSEAA